MALSSFGFRSMKVGIAYLALFAITAAGQISVSVSGVLAECQTVDIDWSGGLAPYTLTALWPFTALSNVHGIRYLSRDATSPYSWTVSILGGINVTLQVTDSTNASGSIGPFTVQLGSVCDTTVTTTETTSVTPPAATQTMTSTVIPPAIRVTETVVAQSGAASILSAATSSFGGLSPKQLIGLSVGVTVAGIGILAGILFLCFRLGLVGRKGRRNSEEPMDTGKLVTSTMGGLATSTGPAVIR